MNKRVLILIITTCFLSLLGLILIFDTTSADVLDRNLSKSMYYAVSKQMLFVSVSFAAAFAVYRIGYEKLLSLSPVLFAILLFLLAMTLLPGVGIETNGAKRWIGVGPFVLQPSEFVKIVLPLFYIYSLRRYERKKGYFSFLTMLSLVMTPLPLIFLEPDNGTVAILLVIICTLLFISKIPSLYWALPIGVFFIVAVGFASQMQHVSDRIQIYLHPEYDLLGKGHQPYQAKIAAGSGGLLGRGPGQSLQKLSYLPEANNDYIGAIYAEEYGFIGICVLLFAYILLQLMGYWTAIEAETKDGYYLATIMTFLIGFQAFINLGIVSGLLPSTGTTLPFISQGGSSLLCNVCAVGVIASIGKKEREYEAAQ